MHETVRLGMQDTMLVDQVREVMAGVFGIDENDIPDEISQETYRRWDSLYHMTLLLTLEDQFQVSFSMDEMPEMTSLSKILSVLEQHGVA